MSLFSSSDEHRNESLSVEPTHITQGPCPELVFVHHSTFVSVPDCRVAKGVDGCDVIKALDVHGAPGLRRPDLAATVHDLHIIIAGEDKRV